MGNSSKLPYFVVAIAIIYNMLPNVLEPVLWTEPSLLPSLEGNLKPNTVLDATTFKYLNVFSAPESIAFDDKLGFVYASLNDGRVISLTKDGEYIRTIFFTGSYISDADTNSSGQLMDFCIREAAEKRLAWDPENERKCGRPLGLRFKRVKRDALLYITDAYHGIFVINIKTAAASTTVTHLIKPDSEFSHTASGAVDSLATLPMKFFNDLDVFSDGSIVFTDSSTKFTRSENRKELLDAAPRGRLLRYDSRTGKLSTLLCGLHFPNGVQLLSDTELLVVESARFRILKVNLPKLSSVSTIESCAEYGSLWQLVNSTKGQIGTVSSAVSVFLDSAPGFLDNIRLNTYHREGNVGTSTNTVSLFVGVGTKSTQPFSLLWFAYQTKVLRDVVGKLVPMSLVEYLVPRYGLVIELDNTGQITRSFHSPSGRVAFISEAQRHPITGDMWLGSHSNPYIAILPSSSLD